MLRQKAQPVPPEHISSPEIQLIIEDMKTALDAEEDGAALAAPQIGKSLRLFIVSKRVVRKERDSEDAEDLVFINPEIVKTSRKKELMEEGCLSVRGFYGKVNRAIRATITAYDEHGKKFERGAGGLMAQIFQHEIDHLDGVLFDDKATQVWESNPEHQ